MIRRWALALVFVLQLTLAAHAQVPPEGPFVEHRVVLQLSDNAQPKLHQVLNNARNMQTIFGAEKVAVVVVAFGPGIEMMREDGPEQDRVRSLAVQGVHFEVCQNTIDTWEADNGRTFPISTQASRVPSGVAQIVILAEHGYTDIRP